MTAPPPGLGPPAPGWYGIAVLVLGLTGWLFLRRRRRLARNLYRRQALDELERIAASLDEEGGERWPAELDGFFGGDDLAYGAPGRVTRAPRADLPALLRLAREWIVRRRP